MDGAVRVLNGLLMLALPLALGAILARRLGQRWGLFAVGAAAFVAAQALHLPFNLLLLNPRLDLSPDALTATAVGSAALLGLSAGVFEESARYLVLRYGQREARSWGQALMLGAGHGGVESILLGLIVLLTLFQMVAYRDADLTALLAAEQLPLAQQQIQAYWSVPAAWVLLGALERLFALCIHLSLSVMVMRVFTHRRRRWLAAAIGWHALVNAVAVLSLPRLGPAATEAVLGVLALISVGLVYRLRAGTDTAPPVEVSAEAALAEVEAVGRDGRRPAGRRDSLSSPPAIRPEAIERSRYSDG